jgi:hypothetical protein
MSNDDTDDAVDKSEVTSKQNGRKEDAYEKGWYRLFYPILRLPIHQYL